MQRLILRLVLPAAFASDHAGLRGDVRYFRNFKSVNFGEPSFPGTLDSWRASIGVAFR
jgi:hypothetical protein